MLPSARPARRAIKGAIGTGALAGAMLFGAAAIASAAAGTPRSAAVHGRRTGARDVRRHVRHVDYLTDHPAVNDFFTSLKGQPRDQISDEVTRYLDANPGVRTDLQAIRQPSVDFRQRCGAPATP